LFSIIDQRRSNLDCFLSPWRRKKRIPNRHKLFKRQKNTMYRISQHPKCQCPIFTFHKKII